MPDTSLSSQYRACVDSWPQDMRGVSRKAFVEVARFINNGFAELLTKDRALAAWLKANEKVDVDLITNWLNADVDYIPARDILNPYNANTPEKFREKYGNFLHISDKEIQDIFGTTSEEQYLAHNTLRAKDGSKKIMPDDIRDKKIIEFVKQKLQIFEKKAAVKINSFFVKKLETNGSNFIRKVFALAASKIHSAHAAGFGRVAVDNITEGFGLQNTTRYLAQTLLAEINKSGTASIRSLRRRKKSNIRQNERIIKEARETLAPNSTSAAQATTAQKTETAKKMRRGAAKVRTTKISAPRARVPEVKAPDVPKIDVKKLPKPRG